MAGAAVAVPCSARANNDTWAIKTLREQHALLTLIFRGSLAGVYRPFGRRQLNRLHRLVEFSSAEDLGGLLAGVEALRATGWPGPPGGC